MDKCHKDEEDYHNNWASIIDISSSDEIISNESCTAPEMRYMIIILEPFADKTTLNIVCCLGAALVSLLLKGAIVTYSDISNEMSSVTAQLAKFHNTNVILKRTSAENYKVLSTIMWVGVKKWVINEILQSCKTKNFMKSCLASALPGAYLKWISR